MNVPNPGSAEAREQGCICPIIDNYYGLGCGETDIDGVLKPVFYFREGCPLHDGGTWLDSDREAS